MLSQDRIHEMFMRLLLLIPYEEDLPVKISLIDTPQLITQELFASIYNIIPLETFWRLGIEKNKLEKNVIDAHKQSWNV